MFFQKLSQPKVSYTTTYIENYLKSTKNRKLHLGCGENIIPTWLNSDLNEGEGRVSIDVTSDFALPRASFKYIYSEHLIEHVSYESGQKMLSECYRVLKVGGKIRVATPNLAFLIDIYQNPSSKLNKKYLTWAVKNFSPYAPKYLPGFLLNNFVRAWGHQFIYDQDTLTLALKSAGFTQIKRVKPHESKDPSFLGLEFHARDMGDEFYGLETLILEAQK